MVEETFGVEGSDRTPLVYRVGPGKVIAFSKHPFSQTTYWF